MSTLLSPKDIVGRRSPAEGVLISLHQPTIVFLTVCAKDRATWLANAVVQQTLEEVWRTADAWLVGFYLLMPDHLHLFCTPRDINVLLKSWRKYWKREFSCRHLRQAGEWQRKGWDS